jgi:hypothetical protein
MVVPRQGRRERSYPCDTGATEDVASGRAARPCGTALRFAKPSYLTGAGMPGQLSIGSVERTTCMPAAANRSKAASASAV